MACSSSSRYGSIGVEFPLLIKQGGTFRKYFTLQTRSGATVTPIDITGSEFHAEIRKKPDDAAAIVEFTCDITDALDGTWYIELTDTQTEAIEAGYELDAAKSRYWWDCEWHKPNGDIIPLMHGDVKVHREITRA